MNFKRPSEFTEYLRNTLVPDLLDSGSQATAEDFEEAVEHIDQLLLALNRVGFRLQDVVTDWRGYDDHGALRGYFEDTASIAFAARRGES
jgi:hypothetical protein